MAEFMECPFCGEVPTLTKKPMWQGSHGYYGCYGFSVKCENEDCAITPFTRTFDTIYEKDENKQKEKAAAAWNRRAQPENKPLSLDELRQMDGEPVWVMHQDGSGARWGIVQDTEYGLCAVVDDDTAYWFTDVCGTIAYRSKPKEEV